MSAFNWAVRFLQDNRIEVALNAPNNCVDVCGSNAVPRRYLNTTCKRSRPKSHHWHKDHVWFAQGMPPSYALSRVKNNSRINCSLARQLLPVN